MVLFQTRSKKTPLSSDFDSLSFLIMETVYGSLGGVDGDQTHLES